MYRGFKQVSKTYKRIVSFLINKMWNQLNPKEEIILRALIVYMGLMFDYEVNSEVDYIIKDN